jgi:hypothetical protein
VKKGNIISGETGGEWGGEEGQDNEENMKTGNERRETDRERLGVWDDEAGWSMEKSMEQSYLIIQGACAWASKTNCHLIAPQEKRMRKGGPTVKRAPK